eukprot:m.9453 g.9453  ORF g.9453 m.9453 type:complete len:246 (-) comp2978_c0_seq1:98-835(-)
MLGGLLCSRLLLLRATQLGRTRAMSTLSSSNVLRVPEDPSAAAALIEDKAVPVLQDGGVVAVPTDTIYGLAGLAQSTAAIRAIYAIKGRDASKPVAICVPEISDIATYGQVTVSQAVLEELLPGAVTVVFERTPALNPELNPDTRLVGIRVPDAGFVRQLTAACRAPLALTSANRSSEPSTVAVEEFEHLWPRLGAVFDGGRIHSDGLGSTVVDLSEPGRYRIIRDGSALAHTEATLQQHGLTRA